MSNNFWLKIKRPILALAPMAGFTDSAFRQIAKGYGADVLYSEMVSATALYYSQKIRGNKTLALLKFNRLKEKYYVVQLFGSNPQHLAVATRIISQSVKPAGIDLNLGCPVPKVIRQGAGAGLMKNLKQARLAIEAILANTDLPVSIKIRAGAGEINALELLKTISDLKIAAVMIHGRTLKQGFVGQPDWKIIKQARKYFSGIILANGGISDLTTTQKALHRSQADGLGIARGALGRPWLFREIKQNKIINFSRQQIFKLILKQAELNYKLKGKTGIVELRKHLVWYAAGLPGASQLRSQLVKINNLKDVKDILKNN